MFLSGIEGTIVDRREGDVQWKIPDCKTMHTMPQIKSYTSPPIHFLMRSWCLRFYPNGDENNEGYFTVHLVCIRSTQRKIPLTLNISLNLSLDEMDDASQIKHRMKKATHTFTDNDYTYEWEKILESVSVWTNKPNSSAITIYLSATEDSLQSSSFDLSTHGLTSRALLEALCQPATDVTFRVEGRTYKAHKFILGVCSRDFDTLFKENKNIQEFLVENCDPDVFNTLLQFLYNGTILDKLSLEEIKNLYDATAVWYKDLAGKFAGHMQYLVSEDTYKGIRDLAAKHNDELLLKATARFHKKV